MFNYLEQAAKGQFITVTFVKANGTLRTINGRFGVKRHLKGGKATIDATKYAIIYSVQDKGYRAINRTTIKSVKINGITY